MAAAYVRPFYKIMRNIYLDHAATTQTDPRVLAAMLPYLKEQFGNADSRYALGRSAAAAVLSARDVIRLLIGGSGGNVYFTSCGSEANSWALKGVCAANFGKKHTIVLSAIEHPSLLRAAEDMAVFGYNTVLVYPDGQGIVTADAVRDALSDDVAFVGVMAANNETGIIQPASQIYEVCRSAGAFYFCDCVQAAGTLDLSSPLGDGMSFSAHKFYGPKGVGGLWLRRNTRIERLVSGGQQEGGMRGGTTFVAGVVGMAEALKIACNDMEAENARVGRLRDLFARRVLSSVRSRLVGSGRRLPSNADIAFSGCRGEQLVISLDMLNVSASTGSACSSGASKPSSVLLAMGMSEEEAASCVRFTFGRENMQRDAETAADRVISAARELGAHML